MDNIKKSKRAVDVFVTVDAGASVVLAGGGSESNVSRRLVVVAVVDGDEDAPDADAAVVVVVAAAFELDFISILRYEYFDFAEVG